jgi:hypothetical protein
LIVDPAVLEISKKTNNMNKGGSIPPLVFVVELIMKGLAAFYSFQCLAGVQRVLRAHHPVLAFLLFVGRAVPGPAPHNQLHFPVGVHALELLGLEVALLCIALGRRVLSVLGEGERVGGMLLLGLVAVLVLFLAGLQLLVEAAVFLCAVGLD